MIIRTFLLALKSFAVSAYAGEIMVLADGSVVNAAAGSKPPQTD
jgi:hypothetical protein